MIEEDSKALKIILEDISTSLNATHVFAIDVDGIPISAYSISGYFEFEVFNQIAALFAASFETTVDIGAFIDYGIPRLHYYKFDEGSVVGMRFNNMLLVACVAEEVVNISEMEILLGQYTQQLEAILPSLQIIEETIPAQDLKNIFSSEANNFNFDAN